MKAFDMRFLYAPLATGFRSGLRGLFGVLVCCSALSVHAGAPAFITKSSPSIVKPTPNTAKVEYVSSNTSASNARSYQFPPAANDGVMVSDAVKVGIGGAVIDVVTSRLVPPSAYPAIAVAAVSFAGGYYIGEHIRDYFAANDIQVNPDGTFAQVTGGHTLTNYRYQWAYQGTYSRGSIDGARDAIAAAWIKQLADAGWSPSLTSNTCSPSGAYYVCAFNATTRAYGPQDLSVQVSKIADTWCMDSGGVLTVRPTGGLCPAGQPQPVPADDVPPLLTNPPVNAPGVVGDAVDAGVPVPAAPPVVTGPATAPGPGGKTVTGPDGATVTDVVNNYHYYGDTITVTTTTTTTAPDGSSTTEQGEPKDDRTDCERNPVALGCLELGEVPDEEVEKVTRDVSVSGESVNLPSGCPADIQAGGQVFSFASACTFSQGVSPFVIAAAALMASLIVLRSIQGA